MKIIITKLIIRGEYLFFSTLTLLYKNIEIPTFQKGNAVFINISGMIINLIIM